jgi:hypothetical protein
VIASAGQLHVPLTGIALVLRYHDDSLYVQTFSWFDADQDGGGGDLSLAIRNDLDEVLLDLALCMGEFASAQRYTIEEVVEERGRAADLAHFVSMSAKSYSRTRDGLLRGDCVPTQPTPNDSFCDLVGRFCALGDVGSLVRTIDDPPDRLPRREFTLDAARMAKPTYAAALRATISTFLGYESRSVNAAVVSALEGRATIQTVAFDLDDSSDDVRRLMDVDGADYFAIDGDAVTLSPHGRRHATGLLHRFTSDMT